REGRSPRVGARNRGRCREDLSVWTLAALAGPLANSPRSYVPKAEGSPWGRRSQRTPVGEIDHRPGLPSKRSRARRSILLLPSRASARPRLQAPAALRVRRAQGRRGKRSQGGRSPSCRDGGGGGRDRAGGS